MITIFLHRNARTESATSLDRSWLNPAPGASLWVDLAAPSLPEAFRRSASAQRDVVGRLVRREFMDLSAEMTYRFRDVSDHLAQLTDEAAAIADRLAGGLAAGAGLAGGRRWM